MSELLDGMLASPKEAVGTALVREQSSDEPAYIKELEGSCCLVGLGGQGTHVVLAAQRRKVRFLQSIVINTDYKDNSTVSELKEEIPVFILGRKHRNIGGGGAGGNPTMAAAAFMEERDSIKKELEKLVAGGLKVIFIAVGLGGGTGTGLILPFLRLCEEVGITNRWVLATIPSYANEGEIKFRLAESTVASLEKSCEGIMPICNDYISYTRDKKKRKVQDGKSLQDVRDEINDRLVDVLQGFAEVMLNRSQKNIDINDLINAVKDIDYLGEKVEEPKETGAHPEQTKCAKLFYMALGITDSKKKLQGVDRVMEAMRSALSFYYFVGHGNLETAKQAVIHVMTPRGSGHKYTPADERKVVELLQRLTKVKPMNIKPGDGEATFDLDIADFKDDAVRILLLATKFDKTPSQALKETKEDIMRLMAAEKELQEEENMYGGEDWWLDWLYPSDPADPMVAKEKKSTELPLPKQVKGSVVQVPLSIQNKRTHEQKLRNIAEKMQVLVDTPQDGLFPLEVLRECDERTRGLAMEREQGYIASYRREADVNEIEVVVPFLKARSEELESTQAIETPKRENAIDTEVSFEAEESAEQESTQNQELESVTDLWESCKDLLNG